MMNKRITLPILLALFTVSMLYSAPLSFWFDKGNGYYEEKKYDSAVVYYEKVITEGMENTALFYNTGNAHFRNGSIGKALLYYEKAQQLSPNDEDIRANIIYVKSQLVDKIPEPKTSFLEVIFGFFHKMFTLETQLWLIFLFLMILSSGFIALSYIGQNKRLWVIYGMVVVLILTLFNGGSAGKKIYDIENTQYAIVLTTVVDALNEPNGDKTLFTIHEGIKFQVMKFDRDWCFVCLANGSCGWVQQSALGFI